MLKIAEYRNVLGEDGKSIRREKIDLKELEKFGFKYNDNSGQYEFCERNINGATYIYINVWNRKIVFRQERRSNTECLNILFDLIQAGLVEKV